ncbi:galactokinase [Weissella cibaria]|jgi:galactokinase|uniref:galactokinase n=1 Tax=Weissella TaxID=46255 RepID=UPI0002191806|nr:MULTISPECIES: galactokinase [Weissella]APS26362.1 Galactokinase [Weissella cibaria]APU63865.1 Galactokinase [Weissella cibaria]APU66015.1 Galactokinase [Weissella cibaria]ASS52709.1 Galactokinase [Weissella cibaria]KXU09037.1 Galactokinase [Weissella sp. DD23]
MAYELQEELAQSFNKRFGYDPAKLYFSPGRVNLIGEYTDFNGGHVFPAAISVGTYGAIAPRDDNQIRTYSANYPEAGIQTITVTDLALRPYDTWIKYLRGVMTVMAEAGYPVSKGFDLAIVGDMPTASGLSSSASLEILLLNMLKDMMGYQIDKLTIVKLGQAVENDYLGLKTGIMDQFAVAFGEDEQGIFLDTNTMAYEMVPAEFGEYRLLVMTTNKKRELTDSKYNERRAESEEALALLQENVDVETLGDLTVPQFEAAAADFEKDHALVMKRARHAVSENQRTIAAKAALQAHDLVQFGELLTASHASLRDDFEVSGIELDTLVETALRQPGVLGARMTGAGFGGSAIALVEKDQVPAVTTAVGDVYTAEIGYQPAFFVAEIVAGTHEIA